MKRIIITVGAALLVAVPAALGILGNTSFAQSVPVRVPSQATVVDNHGGKPATPVGEPEEEHIGLQSSAASTESPDDNSGQRSTSPTKHVDHQAGHPAGIAPPRPHAQNDSLPGKDHNSGHGLVDGRTGGGDDSTGHR